MESDTGDGAGEGGGPSLDELRCLWDVPSQAVIVVDAALRVRSANLAFAHLSGSDQASLVGRSLEELNPLATAYFPIIARAIASGEPVIGLLAPADFAELALDVFPVGAGGPDPRAVIVMSDRRHRPIGEPDGAGGARDMYFDFARRLARVTCEEAGPAIEEALRFVGEAWGLERAFVRLLADDEAHYVTRYEYHRPDLPPLSPSEITVESVAWAHERFVQGEVVVLSSPDDLPAEDQGFRAALERVGVKATVSVPIVDGPRLLGYVAYPATEGRVWSRWDKTRLRHFGEIIAAVVIRLRAEEDLRERLRFEELLSAGARRFVDIAPGDVDAEVERTLATLGEARKLDRVLLLQLDHAGMSLYVTHEWCAQGAPSIRALLSGRRTSDLSPLIVRALAGEAILGYEENAAPGSELEQLLRMTAAHAIVLAPLHIEGQAKGVMMVQTLAHRWHHPASQVSGRLTLTAEVIGAALSQRVSRERIQLGERRFRQILESAMDGIVLLDPSGVVRDWTAQASSVFGVGREMMVGTQLSRLILVEDRATLSANIAAAVSSASAQRFELRGMRSDGRVVPIELSVTRLERTEGALIAAFVRDITDRKRVESEKQRAFDEVSRQKRTLERERDYLREERGEATILGESPAIRQAIEMVDAVADAPSQVLLLGESGVGKELFAAALHAHSSRANGPFVKVNCASVPASLFESEFFGHVKGSFTGAMKDRIGRFELAHGGTLFLDEVGEIPLDLQAKLLRVLQEGEIERIGEDRTRRLDVRIIAATNRDLEVEVREGRFRKDLYFRLGVFPIGIPPLRERGTDVVLLARHFLSRHMARVHRSGLSLSPDDEARLVAYEWPGNVRELDHVIERAVILSRAPPLRLDLALPYRGSSRSSAPPELLREDDLRKLERENLSLALKKAGGRVSGPGGAADLLGMHPSTLRDRMKAFGLSRAD